MKNAISQRLQQWYASHCNGAWEKDSGVTIETLENPGWRVKIDVVGTRVQAKPFSPVAKNVTPLFLDQAMGNVPMPYLAEKPLSNEWVVCFVKNGCFEGAGSDLDEILSVFLDWAEAE